MGYVQIMVVWYNYVDGGDVLIRWIWRRGVDYVVCIR